MSRFSETYKQQVRDVLADNGIDDPKPGEWYSQQAWLDAFEVLATELEPHLLDRIGEQIPETADGQQNSRQLKTRSSRSTSRTNRTIEGVRSATIGSLKLTIK